MDIQRTLLCVVGTDTPQRCALHIGKDLLSALGQTYALVPSLFSSFPLQRPEPVEQHLASLAVQPSVSSALRQKAFDTPKPLTLQARLPYF